MSHDVALPGLDGGNPLAFLAALGTHRTAARTWTEQNITMSWAAHNGSWSPCLHSVPVADQDSFLHRLAGSLESDPHKHPIAFMHSVHGASQEALRSLFRDQAEGAAPRRREVLDYLGALVS
ncbi:MAG: type I-G CRISPR-associated protein, Cas3-extension family, partial [Terriglobales bacterium]